MRRTTRSRAPDLTMRRRAIGLFVAWQVCFLVGGTAFDYVPSNNVTRALRRPFRRWSELTCQRQGWGFFTGLAVYRACFAMVEFRWDGRVETQRSAFEPADQFSYFQPVLKAHRRFDFESKLTKPQGIIGDTVFAGAPSESWKKYMSEVMDIHGESMYAFLRWSWRNYVRDHSNVPAPQQVVLIIRVYTPPPPDQPRAPSLPMDRIIACWRPGAEPPPGYWPIEIYFPSSGQFEPLINAATR